MSYQYRNYVCIVPVPTFAVPCKSAPTVKIYFLPWFEIHTVHYRQFFFPKLFHKATLGTVQQDLHP
jgi:hypothetical protein